jgi:hypothetical protein
MIKRVLRYQIVDKQYRRVIKAAIMCPFESEGHCTHMDLTRCCFSSTCPLEIANNDDDDDVFGAEVIG